MSCRSLTSYPSGRLPPIHMPLRLEAAILARMRSPVTSRSNWAKESRTLSVSRPIDVVVLNCWVTDEGDAASVEYLNHLGEVGERAGEPVELGDYYDID